MSRTKIHSFHTLVIAQATLVFRAYAPYLTHFVSLPNIQEGFDVYNALDVMENDKVFKELKFGIGDGNLQFYLYNWQCPEMKPGDVGLVLL